MKNKKGIITLIIVLTIILVLVSIFFVLLFKNDFKGFKIGVQTSNELILDKTYEEEFNKIIIDATISEIDIKKSDSNNIKTKIYGEKDYIDVQTSLDTLNIKTSEKNCIGICFNQKSTKIEIYLPEEYDDNIDIKNDYGDIFIDEFLNANIEVEEDCGDVKISNVNDITIKNSYGDIEIKSVNNYLHLENDCGAIKVNNIDLKKDSYIKDDYGDIEIGNTNQIFIDAKTDLGKVNIKNNYNKSDVTLKIENDCGDIDVNN